MDWTAWRWFPRFDHPHREPIIIKFTNPRFMYTNRSSDKIWVCWSSRWICLPELPSPRTLPNLSVLHCVQPWSTHRLVTWPLERSWPMESNRRELTVYNSVSRNVPPLDLEYQPLYVQRRCYVLTYHIGQAYYLGMIKRNSDHDFIVPWRSRRLS